MIYQDYRMDEKAIKKQIEAIQKATKNACRSKESALQFLIDAKIILRK